MATRDEMATSFGSAASDYEKGRPGYPREAVAWLLQRRGAGVRIVDVGAGTGKLTRTVIELGGAAEVIAVDPDDAMLAALRAALPGIETLIGTAEKMNLPDESVDAVVFGQAWHWVDPERGSAEVGRILKPGGVLGLIWNIRDGEVPWVARLGEIMHGSHAEEMIAQGLPPVAAPFGELDTHTWRWERVLTGDELKAMVLSRSYIITAPEQERERIAAEVDALITEVGGFDDGLLRLPYVTHAFRAIKG